MNPQVFVLHVVLPVRLEVAVADHRAELEDGLGACQAPAGAGGRTGALDELVLSLTAKGLTSGEIVSHLAQTYGMTTTKETISTI